MNCPKCNAPLESLFVDTEGEQPFTLPYGKRHEPASVCTGGCPGMFTQTNIEEYRAMLARRKKKRFNEEKPEPIEKPIKR